MVLTLSAEVPALIQAHLGEWLKGWLKDQGLCVDNVGSWAVHPGGPRILEAVEDGLALENAHLRRHGNMSSVLFAKEGLAEGPGALRR